MIKSVVALVLVVVGMWYEGVSGVRRVIKEGCTVVRMDWVGEMMLGMCRGKEVLMKAKLWEVFAGGKEN